MAVRLLDWPTCTVGCGATQGKKEMLGASALPVASGDRGCVVSVAGISRPGRGHGACFDAAGTVPPSPEFAFWAGEEPPEVLIPGRSGQSS